MRMQRNSSSFGRRDDETEDRKEIYLSILFFFELFSVGARKIIHKTPPRLTLATREGERVRVVLDLSAEGVSLLAASFFLTCSSSSFVVKSYENSFFCLRPDRWSLVWRRRCGFQMAKREGSRIFHQNFECFRRSSCIGGEGGAAFYFPSL